MRNRFLKAASLGVIFTSTLTWAAPGFALRQAGLEESPRELGKLEEALRGEEPGGRSARWHPDRNRGLFPGGSLVHPLERPPRQDDSARLGSADPADLPVSDRPGRTVVPAPPPGGAGPAAGASLAAQVPSRPVGRVPVGLEGLPAPAPASSVPATAGRPGDLHRGGPTRTPVEQKPAPAPGSLPAASELEEEGAVARRSSLVSGSAVSTPPATSNQRPATAFPAAGLEEKPLRPEEVRILVVELNNPIAREMVSRIRELLKGRFGFPIGADRVRQTRNFEDAVEWIQGNRPQLVFTPWPIPKRGLSRPGTRWYRTGSELLRRAKKSNPSAAVYLMAVPDPRPGRQRKRVAQFEGRFIPIRWVGGEEDFDLRYQPVLDAVSRHILSRLPRVAEGQAPTGAPRAYGHEGPEAGLEAVGAVARRSSLVPGSVVSTSPATSNQRPATALPAAGLESQARVSPREMLSVLRAVHEAMRPGVFAAGEEKDIFSVLHLVRKAQREVPLAGLAPAKVAFILDRLIYLLVGDEAPAGDARLRGTGMVRQLTMLISLVAAVVRSLESAGYGVDAADGMDTQELWTQVQATLQRVTTEEERKRIFQEFSPAEQREMVLRIVSVLRTPPPASGSAQEAGLEEDALARSLLTRPKEIADGLRAGLEEGSTYTGTWSWPFLQETRPEGSGRIRRVKPGEAFLIEMDAEEVSEPGSAYLVRVMEDGSLAWLGGKLAGGADLGFSVNRDPLRGDLQVRLDKPWEAARRGAAGEEIVLADGSSPAGIGYSLSAKDLELSYSDQTPNLLVQALREVGGRATPTTSPEPRAGLEAGPPRSFSSPAAQGSPHRFDSFWPNQNESVGAGGRDPRFRVGAPAPQERGGGRTRGLEDLQVTPAPLPAAPARPARVVLILGTEPLVAVPAIAPHLRRGGGEPIPVAAVAADAGQAAAVRAALEELGVRLEAVALLPEYRGDLGRAVADLKAQLIARGWEPVVALHISDLAGLEQALGLAEPEAFAQMVEGLLEQALRRYP